MGSWNGTCVLSNLPIRWGSRAVAYVIQYNEWEGAKTIQSGGVCYSTTYANPISLPIRGDYDTYGRVENCDGLALELASSVLKIPKDDVINELERGHLPNHSIVLMLEDVHDRMVASVNDVMTKPGYYGKSLAISADDIKKFVSDEINYRQKEKDIKDNPTEEGIRLLMDRATSFLNETGNANSPRGADFPGLVKYILDNNIEDYDTLVEEYVKGTNEWSATQIVMERLRKLWLVPSGSGSQGEDYETYLMLIEAMRQNIFDNLTDEGPEYLYRLMLKK